MLELGVPYRLPFSYGKTCSHAVVPTFWEIEMERGYLPPPGEEDPDTNFPFPRQNLHGKNKKQANKIPRMLEPGVFLSLGLPLLLQLKLHMLQGWWEIYAREPSCR